MPRNVAKDTYLTLSGELDAFTPAHGADIDDVLFDGYPLKVWNPVRRANQRA
jgi:hypothetical protein